MPQGQAVTDAGWALEIALDVEWAHAVAPKASILLVEAKSASLADMTAAVSYAAQQPGVTVVSMSWGASEFSGETSYDSVFTQPSNHPGVTNPGASSMEWYHSRVATRSPSASREGVTGVTVAARPSGPAGLRRYAAGVRAARGTPSRWLTTLRR